LNHRKTGALLLVLLVPTAVLIAAYAYYNSAVSSPRVYGSLGACHNVTVVVEYGKGYGYGVNQSFHGLNFTDGSTAFDALRNVTIVEYQYSGSLVLVTAINGVHNNASANRFWQYYINGVYGPVASNLYHLSNNTVLEWRYEASQF